ncbi:gluconokinase [Microbacterium sp.]|uniref:gluconokinase n=1 Tax=Microbacterium sp. TaxID=51671 RepID=UPI0028121136|nr:gluconokinase [Microbacterium sp.]
MPQEGTASIVVMGVQGVGKSTIGRLLAERLAVPYVEGDELHPPRNIELMAAGRPLQDADREPWLHAVGGTLARHHASGVVVACSALKRRYRDVLRGHAPELYVVEPWGPIELVARRIAARTHEYMPPSLLRSQFDTLEPLGEDERGIRVSIDQSPAEIIDEVAADLRERSGAVS